MGPSKCEITVCIVSSAAYNLVTCRGNSVGVALTFQVIVILDIMTRTSRNLPINNHELAVKGTQRRPMEVHNMQIDIRNILRRWQTNSSSLPPARRHVLMVVEHLRRTLSILSNRTTNS